MPDRFYGGEVRGTVKKQKTLGYKLCVFVS